MNRIFSSKLFFYAVVLTFFSFFTTSCLNSDEYEGIYGYTNIGNLTDTTKIIVDNGLVLNIVERGDNSKLEGCQRIFFVVDILKRTSETGLEYNCKLNAFAKVIVSDIPKKSEIEDLSTIGSDSLCVHNMWLSGNYINILTSVLSSKEKRNEHSFTLYHDEEKSSSENNLVQLVLRHNANGDLPTEETKKEFTSAAFYLSFDIKNIKCDVNTLFKIDWELLSSEQEKVDSSENDSSEETKSILLN